MPTTAKPERHYLHGDFVEGDNENVYCRRCDAFVREAHIFDEHPNQGRKDENVARFKSMWKAFYGSSRTRETSENGKRYRPRKAKNCLTDRNLS